MRGLSPETVLSATGAGFALAGAIWLGGGASWLKNPVDAVQVIARASQSSGSVGSTGALPGPFFANLADPPVKLAGIARSPARTAALLEIGNTPPQWMTRGKSARGVTLIDVGAGQAMVETAGGRRIISLGETSQPVSQSSPSTAGQAGSDQAPAGMHMPPPPADAPRAAGSR